MLVQMLGASFFHSPFPAWERKSEELNGAELGCHQLTRVQPELHKHWGHGAELVGQAVKGLKVDFQMLQKGAVLS